MLDRGDPTNANAVPGPSNHPTAYVAPPILPPAPHPATVVSAGALASSLAANQLPSPTARPPGTPVIVPTVVGADGIKEVPRLFELCEPDDLIVLISSMLDRLIEHNDRIPLTPTSLTRFHSRAPPTINVCDYLLRIARYTNVESACLLILLNYVDKVCARMPTFTISSLTVHRFVIAAVSVGSKALSDSFCTNARYARVGGVSIAEMNLLEKEFCEAIDWRLTTTGSVLAHYYTSLVRSHPSYRLAVSPPASPVHVTASISSFDISMSDPEGSDLPAEAESPEATWSKPAAASEARPEPDPSAGHGEDAEDVPRGRTRPSPALIPAWIPTTRTVTASNLPSPVRSTGVPLPPFPTDVLGDALAQHVLSSPSPVSSPPSPSPYSPPHPKPSAALTRKLGASSSTSVSPSSTRRKASRLNPGAGGSPVDAGGWESRNAMDGRGGAPVARSPRVEAVESGSGTRQMPD